MFAKRRLFQLRRAIGAHGIWRAWIIGWSNLREWLRDKWLRIDTRSPVALNLDPDCHDYEPADYRLLIRAFRFLRRNHEQVVLLDYGCGQGRSLAVAKSMGIHQVIGVEIDAGMIAACRENLLRMRGSQRGNQVELVHADARSFDLPDDVNAIFLFNPFQGKALDAVIRKIGDSITRARRRITILYLYPCDLYLCDPPDVFKALDSIRFATEFPVAKHLALKFAVYEAGGNGLS